MFSDTTYGYSKDSDRGHDPAVVELVVSTSSSCDSLYQQTAPDKVGSDRFPPAITRAKFIPAVRLRVANSSM